MDIPLIEQIKIQAQILVPLLKTLQAELGEERAHALVKKALGDLYRKYGETWWRAQGARGLGEKMAAAFENFAAGNALDYAVVKQAPDAFDVDVTGCRYAQFYQEIGAPELGSRRSGALAACRELRPLPVRLPRRSRGGRARRGMDPGLEHVLINWKRPRSFPSSGRRLVRPHSTRILIERCSPPLESGGRNAKELS